MALTHDDVKKLIAIIDSAEHLEEIELGFGDFQIHLWRGGGAARPMASQASPAPLHTGRAASPSPAAPPAAPAPAAALELAPGEVAIRAPMLGTFYRAASPGDPPFVEVGHTVQANDTVCLIEVMKLFNSVRAGVEGTVTRILRDNASLVEFEEPLIVIRTSAKGSR